MTEYQKLENELTSLGWTPEQGMGDHMKFWKEGILRPIIISKSLKSSSRAYKNTLAECRRAEPFFSIGRPSGWTPGSDDQQTEETTPPDNIAEWMKPGSTVRWTGAEKHDYTLLLKKDSVMNQPYVVLTINTNNDGIPDTVTICDADMKHRAFEVAIDDIDSWETFSCSRCNKPYPLSTAVYITDDKNHPEPSCPDCAAAVIDNKQKEKSPITTKRKSPKEEIQELAEELFNELTNPSNAALSASQINEVRQRILDKLETLPKDVVRKMRKLSPSLFSLLDIQEEKTTPYQTWLDMLEKTFLWYIKLNNIPDDETTKQIRSRIFKSGYSFRKTAGFTIMEINTPGMDILKAMWQLNGHWIQRMSKANNNGPFAVLFTCKKEGIRQYSFQNRKDHNTLLKALPDEIQSFQRSEQDLRLEENNIAHNFNINNLLAEIPEVSPNKYSYQTYKDIPEAHDWSTVPAYNHVDLFFDDNDDEDSTQYNALFSHLADKMEQKNPLGTPVCIHLKKLSQIRHPDGVMVYFEYGIDELKKKLEKQEKSAESKEQTLNLGMDKGQVLFAVTMDGATGFSVHEPQYDDPDETQKHNKTLHDVITALCTQNGKDKNMLAEAMQDIMQHNDKNKESIMNENFLDNTNPASAVEAMKDITTRQLLRELKSRGLTFSGLEITIKKTINVEEI